MGMNQSSEHSTTPASPASAHPRKRVFIVRHGERADEAEPTSAWIEKVDGRHFDPPLTDQGHQQALHAATFLHSSAIPADAHPDITAVYSSALLRCLETAAPIAKVRFCRWIDEI